MMWGDFAHDKPRRWWRDGDHAIRRQDLEGDDSVLSPDISPGRPTSSSPTAAAMGPALACGEKLKTYPL